MLYKIVEAILSGEKKEPSKKRGYAEPPSWRRFNKVIWNTGNSLKYICRVLLYLLFITIILFFIYNILSMLFHPNPNVIEQIVSLLK